MKREINLTLAKIKGSLVFAVLLFVISAIAAAIFSDFLAPILLPVLKDMVNKTEGLSGIELFIYIFSNNATVSLISIFSGIALGIGPIITVIINGVFIGVVLKLVAVESNFLELWRILPHGIFELPAVFISLAIGIWLGYNLLLNFIRHYKKKPLMFILPVVMSIVLTIASLFSISAKNAGEMLKAGNIPPSIILLALILSSLVFYTTFSLFLFGSIASIHNKKLRKVQLKTLKEDVYFAIKIFTLIVIPLLIIAALIESLLIILV